MIPHLIFVIPFLLAGVFDKNIIMNGKKYEASKEKMGNEKFKFIMIGIGAVNLIVALIKLF